MATNPSLVAIPETHAGPGEVEIGATHGQVVIYISVLGRRIVFSPEQAIQFATIILEKAKVAQET